ncbi:amidohydrolase family protein, partial [Idiomarina abyssalis]
MKLTHLLAAAVAALFLSACNNAEPQSNETRSADYVIKNVTLVDWLKGEPNVIDQQTLVVNNGYISGVFSNAEAPAFDDNTQVIDAEGQYVLPGMAEMHGHVPPATDFGDFPKRYADDMLFLYIANGVTTVRGMLGYPHQLQLKSDIESGKRLGPTLYLAGPSFSGNTIESVEQVTERVIAQRDEGWDLLKVHPGLTLEEYEAMASTARQADMDFAGHVPA